MVSRSLQKETVKRKIKYFKINEEEQWRVTVLEELLLFRSGKLIIGDFENDEVENCAYIDCSLGNMVEGFSLGRPVFPKPHAEINTKKLYHNTVNCKLCTK